MKLRSWGLIVLLSTWGLGAQAGILFEPYVGYESGTLKVALPDDTETKFTNTSMDAGLRLGFRSGGFWLAAEGLFAIGGQSKPATGEERTYSGATYLASMGYDFSTRIRLFGGYGFQDNVIIKDSTDVEANYYGGLAGKVGLGYYMLPHMCLNVEYILKDYKKYKINNVEHSITDAGAKSMRISSVLVTFSFPVTF